MTFVRYEDWSSRPRGATVATHPIGATLGVALHWEGPGLGNFAHDRCADKVRSIQHFHRDSRGWADIAYNFLVCPHGYVFEGRGVGVRSAANGDTQVNDDYYAVCYLSGQGDPFTVYAKDGFVQTVQLLRANGAGRAVVGHRDIRPEPTACPGDEIEAWLKTTNFATPEDEMEYKDWSAESRQKLLDDIFNYRIGSLSGEKPERSLRAIIQVVHNKIVNAGK